MIARRPRRPAACRRRAPVAGPGARRGTRRRRPAGRGGRAATPGGPPPGPRPDAGPRTGRHPGAAARCRLAAERVVEPALELVDVAIEPGARPRPPARTRPGRRRGRRARGRSPAARRGRRRCRALPDRVQRRVTVEHRQARVLDEAVAAETLQRLGGMGGGALADPVLHTAVANRRNAASPARRSCGRPAARRGGRLGLDGQVGQDVAHGRLVDQQRPEGGAVAGMVDRLDRAAAQTGGRAQQTVQPGVVDHPDDRRHAASLLADQLPTAPWNSTSLEGSERVPSLSLSR